MAFKSKLNLKSSLEFGVKKFKFCKCNFNFECHLRFFMHGNETYFGWSLNLNDFYMYIKPLLYLL